MRRFKLALAVTIAATLTVPAAATPLIGGEETGASQYTNVGAFGVVISGTFFEICTGTLVAATSY